MIVKKLSAMFVCSCLAVAVSSCGKKNSNGQVDRTEVAGTLEEYEDKKIGIDENGYIEQAKKLAIVELSFTKSQSHFSTQPFIKPNSDDFYIIPSDLILYKGDLEDAKITIAFNDAEQTACVYSGMNLIKGIKTISLERCNNGKTAFNNIKWNNKSSIYISVEKPTTYAKLFFYVGAYLPSML